MEVVCGAINSTGNPISILAAERDADNIIAPFDAANDFERHRPTDKRMSEAKTISMEDLLGFSEVQEAFQFFESQADEITAEQINLCSVPAPPFGEAKRAEYFRQNLIQVGLPNAEIDEEGNCFALRQGRSSSPFLVVSAHLDTVFPAETDLTLKRNGRRLMAPGISDDCCGLVALLALARAMQLAEIKTEGSVLFVGTVGEEGSGNLRGARHLLTAGKWAKEIDAFISFDGADVEPITNGALGSRRYRVELTGTGGHSWGDFGVPNPVHGLGRAISSLASYPAPLEPRTTFNVGRIEGGASINAIPSEASMDVDLRSVSKSELLRIDAFFRRAVREAVEEENSSRRKETQPLKLTLNLIGDRPGGETPPSAHIVEVATNATRALNVTPVLEVASTDSNIPIALGIPAVTLGGGGSAGNPHTLDEWYDPSHRHIGLKRGLLVILAMVGILRTK